MESKKKVLIITYYWPPAGGPGVQRWLKFSKYLRDYGWEPVILTTKDGWYPLKDEKLSKDVPEGTAVYKTKSFDPLRYYSKLSKESENATNFGMVGYQDSTSLIQRLSKFIRANFFIPDARRGWNMYALKEAKKIIQSQTIHAIITTGPPHSTHLIGLALRKSFSIPWFADFRDPWSKIFYNKYLPRHSWCVKYDLSLEKAVNESADGVITVSHGLIKEFVGKPKRLEILFNGYDHEDFDEVQTYDGNEFTIVHTGSLGQYQNSDGLWRAIASLMKEDPKFTKDLRLQFVGKTDPYLSRQAKSYGVKELELKQYVNHDEVVQVMKNASALLFIIANGENSNMIIGGKLLEYLASERPLLAIGPINGEASYLLKNHTSFTMFDYEDDQKIKLYLKELYHNWKEKNNRGTTIKNDKIKDFSRKNITKKLAEILDSTLTS